MASALIPLAIGGLGKLFGGGADAKAKQREAEANTARDQEYLRQSQERAFFDQLLAREEEQRTASNDSRKQLMYNDYISNYQPNSSLSAVSNPYTRQIQGPSAGMRETARDPMMAELLKRKMTQQYDPYAGNEPTRAPDFSRWDKALKPGMWEQILGYGGMGMTALSDIMTNMAKQRGASGSASRAPSSLDEVSDYYGRV